MICTEIIMMDKMQVQKKVSHLILNMSKTKESHIQINPATSEGFPIHLPGGLEYTNLTNPNRFMIAQVKNLKNIILLSIPQGAPKIHLYLRCRRILPAYCS